MAITDLFYIGRRVQFVQGDPFAGHKGYVAAAPAWGDRPERDEVWIECEHLPHGWFHMGRIEPIVVERVTR